MILKANGRYVENVAIEYNAGLSVNSIIKLTDERESAYQFNPEEYNKIKGLMALEVAGDIDAK
ncbi:MAG: hypothetical protein ABS862_01535 [Carnobacterium inhibens]|uniref:hypothetical protein n=1 Tax=Carnobacterium sp. TaxID=48221 RepID=UPI003314A1C0